MSEFEHNGFVLFDKPTIPLALLRQAKSRVSPILAGECDTGTPHWGIANANQPDMLQRIAQVHVCDHAFHNLLTRSDIGQTLAKALGVNTIKVWGSQLYIKPPHSLQEGHVGWHRDSQHVKFYSKGVVTLWIPLDTSNEASGPLQYIKSSHVKGLYQEPLGGEEQNLNNERLRLTADNTKPWQEVPVILPEGGMSVHHWDLIHGSASNVSDTSRYALSVGIATDDIQLEQQEWDYGFHSVLHDPFFCPVLYSDL